MASTAFNSELLGDHLLVSPPAPDRLPAMLFLAALVHGILIIGVSFNPEFIGDFPSAISLEVTIVADPDQQIDRPDDAAYLAQASQQGGGNTTQEIRPSAPLESLSPLSNEGQENGRSLVDATQHETAADQVVASSRQRELTVADKPRREPVPDEQSAAALEAGSEVTLPLPQQPVATLMIHDDDPRQLVISADTRESTVAAYLDNWKRRIEAVGEDYFPELGDLEGLTGSPTLEVSIDSSGELVGVVIRISSGSTLLDRAALDILERSAPFDPFPAEIRAEYDRVRFAYKWLFAEQLVPAAARLDEDPSRNTP